MQVKELMRLSFAVIKEDATYEEVAKLLLDNKLTGAPVVDNNDQLIGFVSEKDLFRILFPYYESYYKHPESYTDNEARESKANEIRKHNVKRFMKTTMVTAKPNMPVLSAGALMLANGIHKMPVVENGKILGIISRDDIYKTILRTQLFE